MIATIEKVVAALRDLIMEHNLLDQTTRRTVIGIMGVVLVLYTIKVVSSIPSLDTVPWFVAVVSCRLLRIGC